MKWSCSRSILGRIALAAAIVCSANVSAADGERLDASGSDAGGGVLTVRLVALRNNSGQIGCGLWSSAKGFPKDRSVAVQTKWCSVINRESACTFDPVPAGTYAVACFHDENNNGFLDTGLFGIPTEGVVASNHAKGFMGPPSFKNARFSFSGTDTELRLKMGY